MEPSFKTLSSLHAAAENLCKIHDALTHTHALTYEIAVEDHGGLLDIHYSSGINTSTERFKLATESVVDRMKEICIKAYEALIGLVKRLLEWVAHGVKQKMFQLANISTLMNCIDVPVTFDDAIVNKSFQAALEDYDSNTPQARFKNIYENFKASLTDPEIDFLTSGVHYRHTVNLVHAWSSGKYPAFMKKLQTKVEHFIDHGLTASRQVGVTPGLVKDFQEQMRQSLDLMLDTDATTLHAIDALGEKQHDLQSVGNLRRLNEFFTHPSKFFPHLQAQWRGIGFDSLDTDDRNLVNMLNEMSDTYSARIKTARARMDIGAMSSPAEDAFLQITTKIYQIVLQYITILVRLSESIKQAATHAYNATMKSFAYVRHVLELVRYAKGVREDEVQRSIDIIIQRQIQLKALVDL